MKTFHFYLIMLGALGAGLVALLTKAEESTVVRAVFAYLIAFFSAVFYLLDKRNRELVKNGEAALRHLDEREGHAVSGEPHPTALFAHDDYLTGKKPAPPNITGHYSYSKVLNTVFLLFFVGGMTVGTVTLANRCGA